MSRPKYPMNFVACAALAAAAACNNDDKVAAPQAGVRNDLVPPPTASTAPAAIAGKLMPSAIAPNTCAAVVNESRQPGAAVVTWTCDSTLSARRFALQAGGQITTHDGAMCLDVMPPKAKGAPVVIWGCAASEQTQRWTLTAAG